MDPGAEKDPDVLQLLNTEFSDEESPEPSTPFANSLAEVGEEERGIEGNPQKERKRKRTPSSGDSFEDLEDTNIPLSSSVPTSTRERRKRRCLERIGEKEDKEERDEITRIDAEIKEIDEKIMTKNGEIEALEDSLDTAEVDKRTRLEERLARRNEEKKHLDEQRRNAVDRRQALEAKRVTTTSPPGLVFPLEFRQQLPLDLENHAHVGLDKVVAEGMEFIADFSPEKSTQTFRVPPVMVASLARSGKTTILMSLFNFLLKQGEWSPIYVTFNNQRGFRHNQGESDADAFLRAVAGQLLDVPNESQPPCSAKQLEAYLTSAGKPIVLLVDEINLLCNQQSAPRT